MTLAPPLSDADHLAGPDDALVTLVQYGDFECPYSKDVHDIVREIRETHPMGVRFAFRHYPLRPHPNALAAAVAAEEAARQGGFWLLHDRMYEHQLRLRPADLAAVDASRGADAVLAQKKEAVASGIRTTLGLWIDGDWVEEDDLETALVERVIKPLHAAGL